MALNSRHGRTGSPRLLKPVQSTAWPDAQGGQDRSLRRAQDRSSTDGRTNWTTLPANLWQQVSGRVETLGQMTSANEPWNYFPKPAAMKSTASLWNPLKQYPRNILHSGDPGMTWSDLPPFLGAHVVRLLGAVFSPSLSLPQTQEEWKGCEQLSHPLPLPRPCPPWSVVHMCAHPSQLRKHHKQNKFILKKIPDIHWQFPISFHYTSLTLTFRLQYSACLSSEV